MDPQEDEWLKNYNTVCKYAPEVDSPEFEEWHAALTGCFLQANQWGQERARKEINKEK